MEQYGLRPALPGAEHISIGEPATGNQPLELLQAPPAAQQITHVDIVSLEACTLEESRGLDLTVHALLAQHGQRWTAAGQVRGGYVLLRIEAQLQVQSRILRIGLRSELFLSAVRIVPQPAHQEGSLRPGAAQLGP